MFLPEGEGLIPPPLFLSFINNIMPEIKFDISGRFERPNGHIMRGELSFISASKEEAIATCQRNNPFFHIHTVREDHSVPEVVKVQRLI